MTTQGGGTQSNGYFANSSQSIGNGFSATFQYQVTNTNGGNPADGFTFTLQSNRYAVGGAGGNLGYMAGDGNAAISPSVALAFSIYSGNHANTVALGTNGTFNLAGPTANSITGFSLGSGDLIRANLTYMALTHTLALSLQDLTTSSALQNIAYNVDVANVLSSGNLPAGQAYVGFTAGAANFDSTQQFSAFSFTSTPVPEPATYLAGALTLTLGAFGVLHRRQA